MGEKIVIELHEFAVDDAFAERFWSKVVPVGDCWEWQGAKGSFGYGLVKIDQKNFPTHRIAFALANGRAPKLSVLHSCDNPPCVRPDHLWEGTQTDNMKDALAKGRLHMVGDFHRRKTHCSRGHPFDGSNTIRYQKKNGVLERKCRECHNSQERERRRRRAS
ncbi:MAG TPA: hypothetical protein ENI23_05400 [bacterium]|nr:hypothetical protein [bacterium]